MRKLIASTIVIVSALLMGGNAQARGGATVTVPSPAYWYNYLVIQVDPAPKFSTTDWAFIFCYQGNTLVLAQTDPVTYLGTATFVTNPNAEYDSTFNNGSADCVIKLGNIRGPKDPVKASFQLVRP